MPNELLERKIDTNHNGIEEQELLNFIKDTKNLQELWNHLNSIWINRSDNLFRASQQEIQKYLPTIDKKIKSNTPLAENEKSVMKIQYVLEKKTIPTNESALNTYMGSKFNNPIYHPFTTADALHPYNPQEKFTKLINNEKQLTPTEREVQLQTVLEAGQVFVQFLQSKWDVPAVILDTYKTLDTLLKNKTEIGNAEMRSYITKLFDSSFALTKIFGTVEVHDDQDIRKIFKEIETILWANTWRSKENQKNKVVEIISKIRAIDKEKGFEYGSWDAITWNLFNKLETIKLSRWPEAKELQSTIQAISNDFSNQIDATGKFKNKEIEAIYNEISYMCSEVISWHPAPKGTWWRESKLYQYIESHLKLRLTDDGINNLHNAIIKSFTPNIERSTTIYENTKKSVKEWLKKKRSAVLQEKIKKEKELHDKWIDTKTGDAKKIIKYFDDQLLMYDTLTGDAKKVIKSNNQSSTDKLLESWDSIDLESKNGVRKFISIETLTTEQLWSSFELQWLESIKQGLLGKAVSWYPKQIDYLKSLKDKNSPLITDEKIIDLVANITWAGNYTADSEFNNNIKATQEIGTQVLLMAISGWIANIAAKGTLMTISGIADWLEAWAYAARMAKYIEYSKMAEGTLLWSLKLAPELTAVDLVVEWGVFHLANTTLNNALQNKSIEQTLHDINPLGTHQKIASNGQIERDAKWNIIQESNLLWYAESTAFMWISKAFAPLTLKINKKLWGEALAPLQQSKAIKDILTANLITLPAEVISMQWTSAIVGLTFGHWVDLSLQSWEQTLSMVIGLRMAHIWTWHLNKISQKMEEKILTTGTKNWTIHIENVVCDKAGNVESVDYSILDATGKVVEQDIASKAAIESASVKAHNAKHTVDIFGEANKLMDFKSDKKTVTYSALDFLNTQANDPITAKLISALQPYLKNAKIFYQDQYDFKSNGIDYGGTIDGLWNILVFKKNNLNAHTILHEALHDLIFDKMNTTNRWPQDQILIDQVQKIFDKAKQDEWLASRYSYAFTNLDEFVSEAFGNPWLRQELSYIKSFQLAKGEHMFEWTTQSIHDFLKNEYDYDIKWTLLDNLFTAVDASIVSPNYNHSTQENIWDKTNSSDKILPKNWEIKLSVSPEIVKSNAALSPEDRIIKAKELLWTITPAQEQAILDAHNQAWEIYNLSFSQIKVRTEILKKSGFSSEQVRILMENGICGSRKENIENVEKVQKIKPDLDVLWIEITSSNIADLAKLDTWDVEKVKEIKSDLDVLWIEITSKNIVRLAKLDIWDLKKVQEIKPELAALWIEITSRNIVDLAKLNIWDLKKVQEIKPELDGLEVEITIRDIADLAKLDTWDLKKAREIKPELAALWIEITSSNIVRLAKLDIWDLKKVQEIKPELDVLWTKITSRNIADLVKLDTWDLVNLAKIKPELDSLWIKINGRNLVDLAKLYEIKPKLAALWIKINNSNIADLVNLAKIKPELDALWIKITSRNIVDLAKLHTWDLAKLDEIKPELATLWIEITSRNIADLVKIAKIKPDLATLWIEITRWRIANLAKLNTWDLEKLVKIKPDLAALWIEIDSSDIVNLAKLDAWDLEKAKKMKPDLDALWIEIDTRNIAELTKLDIWDLKKVQEIKPELDSLWIKITSRNIVDLAKLHTWDLAKLYEIKPELAVLWIKIYSGDIADVVKLNTWDLEKVKKMKPDLDALWIEIDTRNIAELTKLDIWDLKKVQEIKPELAALWIEIDSGNIVNLAKLDAWDLAKLYEIKPKLAALWIKIDSGNIADLAKLDIWDLNRIKESRISITDSSDLIVAAQLLKQTDSVIIRDFIQRKHTYLEKNRTISQEYFNELFAKEGEISKKTSNLWKYGKSEIHQTDLGYCYAYTWNEILKKSNFFETMVQTSLKKISWWWEIKIPLWNKEGKSVTVYENEIDKEFNILERWSMVNINSHSSLWFKILEIAFIKEYILYNKKYDSDPEIMIARKQFAEKWNFDMNGRLLSIIEWWRTQDFLNSVLWSNLVNSTVVEGRLKKELLFDQLQTWLIKVQIGGSFSENEAKSRWVEISTIRDEGWVGSYKINWVDKIFRTRHAYSIERAYIDWKWNKMVTVIDPWDTSQKYAMTLDQCIDGFPAREANQFNIDAMFK